MTISKSQILVEVNTRTNRGLSQVDLNKYLATIMNDISISVAGLKALATLSFTSGDNVKALPSDYRSMISVDGLVEKSYESLASFRTQFTAEGTPEFWSVLNKQLHIWPTPEDDVDISIRYIQIDDDIDNIEFPDEFKEALIEGCCYKTYEGLGYTGNEFTTHKGLYDDQIAKLKGVYG